jgi:hypothetical protein
MLQSSILSFFVPSNTGEAMMKLWQLHLMHLRLVVFAAAMVLAAGAHAFTIDNKSMTNGDGSPKYVDPDEQIENFGSGGTTIQQGGSAWHFDIRPSYGSGQTLFGFGRMNPFNSSPGAGALPGNR